MPSSKPASNPGTLVTRREIGEMMGLGKGRIHQIVTDADGEYSFPPPVEVLWAGQLEIWYREDVEQWIAAHRPRKPAEEPAS